MKDQPYGKKKKLKRKKLSRQESHNSIESGTSHFTMHSTATVQQNLRPNSFREVPEKDLVELTLEKKNKQKLTQQPKRHLSENQPENL